MASGKSIDKICAVVAVLALLLTVLFLNGEALGMEKQVDEDAERYSGSEYFTANDLNADWDRSDATVVTLEGGGGTVRGGGAYFYDGNLVISAAGRYVLSGALEEGSISVDAYSGSKVWILLDGVTVNCSDDACLRVEQADKVFLTMAEGTENSFTSGTQYSEAALADNTGGVIFARDDLTINGAGSLSLTAGYKHGIDANDELVLAGGSITVTCPQDALHVNDQCNLRDTALTVHAGDDGIHSDTSVYIESGTVTIAECYEGIEAPVIEIAGGDITIYPTDDGLNANGGSGFGFGGFMPGNFNFGEFEFSETDGAGAFPSFSPDSLPPQMPEGFDGETASRTSEAPEAETEETESYIRISGGSLTIVNANARDADGIDSNGSIYITGGSVRVSMANNGCYALDVGSESGGVMEISGGDLIGCGSYAMAESFDSSSTQPSILYTYSAGAEAGTTVALEDSEGNVLLSYTAPCAFSCVNLSCPALEVGGTYLMVIGDNVEEITLSDVSASYGDAQSGGFGGMMNFGGMRPRGNGEDGEGFQSFGGGGRGRGRRGTETEDFPAPPDGGEMPEMPDFGDDWPDFGGGRPDFDGEFPDFPAFPGGADFSGDMEAETEAAADSAVSPEDWAWLGLSAAVLAAGIGFSALYRRRKPARYPR
ncbi:MAG: carbohydrate-binding domain-containing protein [Oscillospiraceae bacterium]|nr:carbohydrate-binding domain-containing protein [Oscillospiraceae bacterium]